MAQIDDDIATVRRWVGSSEPPTDDDIIDGLEEHSGDEFAAELTALAILDVRYADLLAESSSLSVPGFAESHSGDKIKALKSRISELQIITGTEISGFGSIDLCRTDRRGR